jgi:hypothetical protein
LIKTTVGDFEDEERSLRPKNTKNGALDAGKGKDKDFAGGNLAL